MKRIISASALLLILGVFVALPVLAACGGRPDCGDCVAQETCETKLLCYWDTDTCYDQPLMGIASGDITAVLGYGKDLFANAKAIVLLLIGLPVGYWIIKKAIGLVSKLAKS